MSRNEINQVLQKLIITPAGLVSAQHIKNAKDVAGSHVYHSMFDSSDKTNHEAAEDFMAGYNRQAVYHAGLHQSVELTEGVARLPQQYMATVVFLYINDCIYRVYQDKYLDHYSRVMFCGIVYKVVYAWRTWLVMSKDDGLTLQKNFVSIQNTKFLLIQAQGFVTRLISHMKDFPDLPFYPLLDGSDPCENWFRDIKAKSGTFCVKDLSDSTSQMVAGNVVRSHGNVLLPESKCSKGISQDIFSDFPKNESEVKEAFERGMHQGVVLIKLLGMYDQLRVQDRLDKPIIPRWTSTKSMQKTEPYAAVNVQDDDHVDDTDDEELERLIEYEFNIP